MIENEKDKYSFIHRIIRLFLERYKYNFIRYDKASIDTIRGYPPHIVTCREYSHTFYKTFTNNS